MNYSSLWTIERSNRQCCLLFVGESHDLHRIKLLLRKSTTHYEGVSKSFRTGHLEAELQVVQLSATRCSCFTILWVSLVSFAAITVCVASQRVFVVVVVDDDDVYFVIDSVRKPLDTPSYTFLRIRTQNLLNATW